MFSSNLMAWERYLYQRFQIISLFGLSIDVQIQYLNAFLMLTSMANGNHSLQWWKGDLVPPTPKLILSIFSFWVNGTVGHLLIRSKNPGVLFDSFLSLFFIENELKIPAHFSLKTYPEYLSPMLVSLVQADLLFRL